MRIELKFSLVPDQMHEAWKLYQEAFAELNTMTVQNHLMEFSEFLKYCNDHHIRKYLAYEDDALIGMSMMTCRLKSWPLISWQYFATHYPELFERDAVWYIGFVATDRKTSNATFPLLISEMMQPIRATKGIGVLDYSTQVMRRGLDAASKKLIAGCAPLESATIIDRQRYVKYSFDWESEQRP